MAVAGFRESNLSIVVQNDQLTVSGRVDEKEDQELEYLHRGIALRAFERTFSLADHMQVTGAEIKDGMLRVDLVREIPEEAKPRMIPIKAATAKGANESRHLEDNGKKTAN